MLNAIQLIDIKPRSGTLLSITFLLIPTLFDSIISRKLFLCPKNNTKSYSLLLLCAPAICIILLMFAISAQNYEIVPQKFFIKRMLIRFGKRVSITISMVIFAMSSALIYSDYYSCFRIGPDYNNDSNYENKRYEMVAMSRQIGWYLIICSFIIFIAIYVSIKLLFRPKLNQSITKKLIKEIKKQNKNKLDEIVKKFAEKIIQDLYQEAEQISTTSKDPLVVSKMIERSYYLSIKALNELIEKTSTKKRQKFNEDKEIWEDLFLKSES
ncbi:hypothetical protein HZS_1285 [Henneguya salminicola]|nr:hypothetical protein HZS_1285 [Henneguya salminicola]